MRVLIIAVMCGLCLAASVDAPAHEPTRTKTPAAAASANLSMADFVGKYAVSMDEADLKVIQLANKAALGDERASATLKGMALTEEQAQIVAGMAFMASLGGNAQDALAGMMGALTSMTMTIGTDTVSMAIPQKPGMSLPIKFVSATSDSVTIDVIENGQAQRCTFRRIDADTIEYAISGSTQLFKRVK